MDLEVIGSEGVSSFLDFLGFSSLSISISLDSLGFSSESFSKELVFKDLLGLSSSSFCFTLFLQSLGGGKFLFFFECFLSC